KKPPLTDAQLSLLKTWIDQGAKAPKDEAPETSKHWSFVPPKHADLPKVKEKAWVRNSIDNFILARLENEKIKPSPEADRVTLIRRLSFDLLGLPPSVQDVDNFLKDKQ